MNYPQLYNWILIREKPDGNYSAWDRSCDEKYTLGSQIAQFALQLDGETDPYSLFPTCSRQEIREMLDRLNEHEFLRNRRITKQGFGSYTFTTMIAKRLGHRIPLCSFLNFLLMLLWLPALCYGLFRLFQRFPDLENAPFMLGQAVGVLVGLLLHEAAHATAAFGYGATVFEAGFLLHFFMPGAYVMIDDTALKKRLPKVQILAAGVEMNLLLAGIGGLLVAYIPSQGNFFLGFSFINLTLALLNLFLSDGLDGSAVLGKLLGTDCLVDRGIYALTDKETLVRFLKAGPHGIAELLISCLMLLLQLSIPCLYLIYLLESILCLF